MDPGTDAVGKLIVNQQAVRRIKVCPFIPVLSVHRIPHLQGRLKLTEERPPELGVPAASP